MMKISARCDTGNAVCSVNLTAELMTCTDRIRAAKKWSFEVTTEIAPQP